MILDESELPQTLGTELNKGLLKLLLSYTRGKFELIFIEQAPALSENSNDSSCRNEGAAVVR